MDNDRQIDDRGRRVIVKLHDWNSSGQIITFAKGLIHSCVVSPAGYNVKLDQVHHFHGHIPLPFGDFPRPDFGRETVALSMIFVRAFDISFDEIDHKSSITSYPRLENMMKNDDGTMSKMSSKVRKFFLEQVSFGEIVNMPHIKPDIKVSHILYYAPDGTITTLTNDTQVLKHDPNNAKRLVYKYVHFYGFINDPNNLNSPSRYFSSNRYAVINLLEGLKWGDLKSSPPKPEKGALICGVSSGKVHGNSESMDCWFACSEQFKLLADLICGRVVMSFDKAIEKLTFPQNPENLPILTENPQSRHLYAAVWALMERRIDYFAIEKNLPKKRSLTGTQMEPFEIWWPTKVNMTP